MEQGWMRFDAVLMRKAFRAGPTTAPLETAGIGARPVGPGVALTAGANQRF